MQKVQPCAQCLGGLGFGFKFAMRRLGLTHGNAARLYRSLGFRSSQKAVGRRSVSGLVPVPVFGRKRICEDLRKQRAEAKLAAKSERFIRRFLKASESFFIGRSDAQKEIARNRFRQRYQTDPGFVLLVRLRRRLRTFLKGGHSNTMLELVGCSREELTKHVEQQFTDGMSWSNMGDWHIDHKVPCSLFDLSIQAERARCFHCSNLRPMWARDNISKGDSIPDEMTPEEFNAIRFRAS